MRVYVYAYTSMEAVPMWVYCPPLHGNTVTMDFEQELEPRAEKV